MKVEFFWHWYVSNLLFGFTRRSQNSYKFVSPDTGLHFLTKSSILQKIWVCAQKKFVVSINETGTIEGSNFAWT